jgi:methionine transaminase
MGQIQIHSKLPDVGTTIFTVMSALATEHKAVNLGQGFPDFPMSSALTSLVNKAMSDGYNQYSPMPGWMPLREAIAEKIEGLYKTSVNPDTEITITPGGTYAIYTAVTSVLQPGDEVIVFQPGYDSYIPNVTINGAIPVLIDLEFPEYKINWDEVRKKISAKTRMIFLNSPHNPTGAVLRDEDMQQLRSIVQGTNIIILSDEVYEHIVFDDLPHYSILRYPDLREPPAFTKEFRKVHQFNCFSCHTPSQVALATFLRDRDSYLGLGAFLQQKRDFFLQMMQQTRFTMLDSKGSYFICAQYNRISDESDKDFAIRITKEFGIAVIPVSAFYQHGTDNKVVRFCFGKKEETLQLAAERLAKI